MVKTKKRCLLLLGILAASLILTVPDRSQAANDISSDQSTLSFSPAELPAKPFTKKGSTDLANQALSQWSKRDYQAATNTCRSLAQLVKLKAPMIEEASLEAAAKLKSGDRHKAAVLYLISYESLKVGNRATADDSVAALENLAQILTANGPREEELNFASSLVEQALQTRKMAGGIQERDASLVLTYARLEFQRKRWESAQKQYEYWMGMYESKGRKPPADKLADTLAELGITYNSLNNYARADDFFRRAIEESEALTGSAVTPIHHYDVQDFLMYNLLREGKVDEAQELAEQHLKYKEKTLGLTSIELAKELNRYADLFEQAGKTAYSFSLRSRASRVGAR